MSISMIDISKGRYWDKPWSLIDGCTPCSPGCEHCWSAMMTHRLRKDYLTGRLREETGPIGFNGLIILHPERLSIPLKRRKPTVYSVWNDWCHEGATDSFRISIIDMARRCPQHTILALTKRVHILSAFSRWMEIHAHPFSWPDNWWNILTVCNQDEANKKLPDFLKIPGNKGLSIEPMLGPVELSYNRFCGKMGWGPPDPPRRGEDLAERLRVQSQWLLGPGKINAVIIGGETGPGARPLHPDLVRSVRDQCTAAGVDFFFKSWGNNLPTYIDGYQRKLHLRVSKVSKEERKRAHRLLDGRTHDELPWRKE